MSDFGHAMHGNLGGLQQAAMRALFASQRPAVSVLNRSAQARVEVLRDVAGDLRAELASMRKLLAAAEADRDEALRELGGLHEAFRCGKLRVVG